MRVLDGLKLAALLGVAFVAWRTYSKARDLAGDLFEGAGQAIEQAGAEVSQWFGNAFGGLPPPGDPVKAALYSQQGYTGADAITGISPLDGEWLSQTEARQYEYHQQEMSRLLRRPAPVVGPNGAAFGVYPAMRSTS